MTSLLLLLLACGSPDALPQPHDPPAWPMRDKNVRAAPSNAVPDPNGPRFAPWVEERVHIQDADGHGPTPGTSAWTEAVHAKLFADVADAPDMSSPAWGRAVLELLIDKPDAVPPVEAPEAEEPPAIEPTAP
jgi:hypothetical protein